jgi:glycosidase
MRMNRGYISSGRGMHSVMNYLLVDALIRYYKYIDVSKLDNVLQEIMSEYPDETIPALMNFTSTHDISRLIEIFGANAFSENSEWAWNLSNDSLDWINSHHLSDKEYYYGKMSLKSYIIALAFLPGIFSIFYGDEIGLRGIGNLANRAPYTWNNVDDDLLIFFRRICEIRHDEKFLRTANFKVLEITPKYFSFETAFRQSANRELEDSQWSSFRITPEWHITDKLTLKNAFSNYVQSQKNKNELTIVYTPSLKKYADSLKFELGIAESFYANGNRSQSVSFSTGFRLK